MTTWRLDSWWIACRSRSFARVSIVAAIFAFITSFDQVETTLYLVRPGANTLPIEMFLYLQKWQDPTIAALSVVLILFAALLMAILGMTLRSRWQALALLRGNKEIVP